MGALMLPLVLTMYAKEPNPFDPKYDPLFEEFNRLHQEMNMVFEKFNSRFFEDSSFIAPTMDFKKSGDEYEIKVNLPGIEEANFKTEVKDGVLRIDASTTKEEKKEGDKYFERERFVGSYHRLLTLPKDADVDKLKTRYKDGVLTITIPVKK